MKAPNVTPGKWFAVLNTEYWEINIGPGQYEQSVGDACASKFLDGGSSAEADARLMAAAPELAEALNNLIGQITFRIDDPRCKLIDDAVAALLAAGYTED